MVTPNVSLKSSLRKSVISSYRSRGRSVSNQWLVYSPKTDSDWILPSDRQLIHWLYYLESNPEVVSFNLHPDPILSQDDVEVRATELDAIANLRDSSVEWHEVKAGKEKDDPTHQSQLIAQSIAASRQRVTYKRFNDIDLEPKVRVAMRWFKAIGYAAAIRGEQHITCESPRLP
jgi:hypothetical protein